MMLKGDCLELLKDVEGVGCWVWDPPYNINFNYGYGFKDEIESYPDWIEKVSSAMFDSSCDDSNLFFIHYAEDCARLLNQIESCGWVLNQWMTWVYPSNFGHSKKKFTRGSRAILWFTKGEPYFEHRELRPYKNQNDKRIKKLMESGRKGVAHYDWLEINLVKNVSQEKRYVNQIPEALIQILISNVMFDDMKVGDPTCGSGSTCRVAKKLGLDYWGCDLNDLAVQCWGDL